MKVELEIEDLKVTLSALSIAINYLNNQQFCAFLGCDLDNTIWKLLEKYNLTNSSPDDKAALLKERCVNLSKIFEQLLKIEKEGGEE